MTLATGKIRPHILDALRQRGHSDVDVAAMTAPGAFCEFCQSYGLIGWGGEIWDTVENLRDAEAGK